MKDRTVTDIGFILIGAFIVGIMVLTILDRKLGWGLGL